MDAEPRWLRPRVLITGLALAAIVMGLPTLRGGFVGGDDHRLVIDHVLVNRPSLEHAIKLFTIVHRDLYQPLPLLTFSGEMAIARALNLFRTGPQGGAWLFHLTNVLLHALVTVAVFYTVHMLHRRTHARDDQQIDDADFRAPSGTPPGSPVRDDAKIAQHFSAGTSGVTSTPSAVGTTEAEALITAALAALLFAIHPLNVETVAWVNGRMMLLSTLFALCGVLAFARWLDRGTRLDAAISLLCIVLSALSKVRVGIPLLLLLVAMMRADWRRVRFWPVWLTAGALTAAFAWINIGATSQADLFAEGAEHLQGPRLARVLLALEHYFLHTVWPAGLTSYYPTPPVVYWTDPQTISAIIVNTVVLVFLALAARRIPAARWGAVWFFIAIADTLPFIPARNVLAADRYIYLPFVGLLWTISASIHHALRYTDLFSYAAVRAKATAAVGLVYMIVLIGVSWYTARWYDNPQLKTLRVAKVFPDEPRVWERYGWTLYSDEDYERAVEYARREFVHEIPAVQSGAWQLIGMSRFKQGRFDEAVEALTKALDIDPTSDLGRFRLGMVYEETGRFADAMPLYEACVRSATSHNPTLHRLARVYRELGRPADARKMYEQELKNNPYEVPASLALADLDFQEGTRESMLAAEQRLLELLEWMPENAAARVNLAHLYDTVGDTASATTHYTMAGQQGFDSLDQAVFAHDFYERHGQLQRLPQLWTSYLNQHPQDAAGASFLAWAFVVAGDSDAARRQISALGIQARSLTMAQAAVALLAIEDGRDDMVRRLASQLVQSGGVATRQRVLRGLERFDTRRPGQAWTYYLTAVLLRANDQPEAASAFIDLFSQHCSTPACLDARREFESETGSK